MPEVIEIQTFLGRVDVRLSMIARDMAHYQHIYRNKILTLPQHRRHRSVDAGRADQVQRKLAAMIEFGRD